MKSRTQRCAERGHPEISIEVDSPAHDSVIARWIGELERRVLAGEPVAADTETWLDGWPALVVAEPDGWALHQLDLTAYAAGSTRYVPGMSQMASLAFAQRELAEAYGLADALTPPDYLQRVRVCSGYRTVSGQFVLARSRPLSDNESGWVLRCCKFSHRFEPGMHAPADAWEDISVVDLLAARPRLVRYLGLPVGAFVDASDEYPPTIKLRSPADRERSDNIALRSGTAYAGFDFHVLPRISSETEARHEDLVLDFDLDADVWPAWPPEAVLIVCERYDLPFDAALAVVDRHFSPEVLRARVRSAFRAELSLDQLIAVETTLTDSARDVPGRAEQNAARKLRELTGKPFAPLLEVVKRVSAALDTSQQLRELWERTKPHPR